MARKFRVRMRSESAAKLLRRWVNEKRALSLRIVVNRGKLNMLFTGGELTEVGKDTAIFHYSTPGVHNMICPEEFKRREHEESDTFERMIFSDSDFTNTLQVIRSKDNKPVLVENLSNWIN